MKVYVIKHGYDVDGGFGDPVAISDVIGFCTTEDKAKEICEKYSNEHVYDTPYYGLKCGFMTYEELFEVTDDMFTDAWWLEK